MKLTHFSAIEQNSRIISTIIDLPNSWVSNFEFHSIIYYFVEVFLYSSASSCMDLGVCIFEGIPRRGRWLFQLMWRPIAKGSRHKWNCQWGGDCKLQNAAAISESWPGNWKQKHWLFQIFTFLALQLSKGRWFTKYCTISIFKFWIGGQIRSLLPKNLFENF